MTNTSPLPDSFYNVGADGILGNAGDSGYTWARVRVIDPEGNSSNAVTDTLAQFTANNALTAAVIDTSPPTITGFQPLAKHGRHSQEPTVRSPSPSR